MRMHARSGPSNMSTAVPPSSPTALGRAEVLAKEYPDGWVYIHVEYRENKE
jgi:hypothetical protein